MSLTLVKLQEVARRRFRAIPARFWAFWLMLLCLAVPVAAITRSVDLVHVSDTDGFSRLLITNQLKPASLVEQAGLELGESDRIYYTAYNGDLASLSIQRAFTVNIEADGRSVPVRLTEGSVKDALQKAGVSMGEYDYTVPGYSAQLAEGDVIRVHRVYYTETVEYRAIPYETEYQQTSLFCRKPRKTITTQKGQDGELAITTRERWVDGELERVQIARMETIREPRPEIVKTYGARVPVSPLTGPDGTTNKPSAYSRVLTGRATGYSSKGGKGSSGLGLGYGTVAVDPSVIPYGTLLYIESTDGKFVYGYALATDTGTAMREGHALVDLYYETYAESVANGVFQVNVYVVG